MELTTEQLSEYGERGYLFLPALFATAEVQRMRERLPGILAQESPSRVLEKDGKTVRSVYGSHFTDPVFRQLTRDARLVEPVERIVGSDLYVYQFKINSKLSVSGDVWAWHQDYIFWFKEDGVLQPELATAVVFLDEVDARNGPMAFIPGSHREAMIDVPASDAALAAYREASPWIANLTADIKYSIPADRVDRLAAKLGIVVPTGPAGSVLFFHPNLVHGSSANVSSRDRVLVLVTYNSVNNRPTRVDSPRPDFLCSRDYTAVKAESALN